MNKKQLEQKRAQLMREADALKGANGEFADDQARRDFDAKMAEVEQIDVQLRALETATSTTPTPAPTADQAVQQERARVKGIRDAVRIAKLDTAVADELVDGGTSLEAARTAIFEKLAERDKQTPTQSHIAIGDDADDKFQRGATNWLLVKGGAAKLVADATKSKLTDFDAGEFRGYSLVELARLSLERRGVQTRGLDKMQLVGRALTTRGAITQSTSDFATLLENVMHKVLQAQYAITPDTWRRFCATSTVADFRAHARYRMGSFASLDALTETGEFKNKTITDAEKATITAATKGNIVNVSRQMIINDDMGAFTRLLTMLGRAAALSIEVDVYALLAQNAGLGPSMPYDSTTLFHANHGNSTTGAALSAAAIDADRVAMASQKDKDGNDYLDLRPALLLVPVALGGTARVINDSQYDPDTVANKSQMKPNLVRGLFRDVIDTPRLSGTRRYLFADPSVAPVLEVAFLEGQDTPVLESQDGWRVDGAEMKVRFDYATAAVDHRGAITNAGA